MFEEHSSDQEVVVERVAESAALRECFEIRRCVFVEGQGVPEAIELDGRDGDCTHYLARLAGTPIGTARLRLVDGELKAERVAVLAEHRIRGVGRALMAAIEADAHRAGHARVLLHAQEPVASFYERQGYVREGEPFLEADIPHVKMTKLIRPTRDTR